DGNFDYDVAANGAVALRVAPGGGGSPAVYMSLPSGGLVQVGSPGAKIEPIGRPVFGPEGNESRFFYSARVLDRARDRQGHVPVGLFRAGVVNGRVISDVVASPGDAVPGKRGAVLLGVTQRPVISAAGVTLGILFGDSSRSPVPTAS